MKDSGIEWIGEIPDDWGVERGKYIFTQRSERGNKIELQLLSPTQKYGVIPQRMYDEISGMNSVKLKESTDLNQLKTIHKGDYCISLRSFQGGFEYSTYEGVVSPAYQVFYPIIKISDGYYKYLFKEIAFIEKINSFTLSLRDGKNIAFSDFANMYLPLPPLPEQQKIADFLDSKCAKIDSLSADIKRQIEILEQYKKSVITECVTGGKIENGELKVDNFKDSGIDWIGKIPEHWEMEKFKYNLCVHEIKGYDDKEVLSLYREFGVVPKNSRDDNHNVTSEDTSKYKYVRIGDFVINKMKAWQGSVAVSEYEGIVSPAYYVYEFTNENYNKRYFHYLMRNKILADEFRRISGGIREGQWDLNRNQFENMYLPLPPPDEQKQIAEYLDSKCAKIDSVIATKKQQLEKLDEYKKSLVFEYVTGKKEL